MRAGWFAIAAIAACGGGGGGGGGGGSSGNDGGEGTGGTSTIVGTIGGVPSTETTAISAVVTTTANATTTSVAAIALSSEPTVCSDFGSMIERKSSQLIEIALADEASGSTTAPTTPGTFVVADSGSSSPLTANAFALIDDASCGNAQLETAVAGTVTITEISGNVFAGSFALDFQASGSPADHVTGTFAPAECAELAVPQENTSCE